ncbi:HAL2-like protein, partial [Prunus dulcis]
ASLPTSPKPTYSKSMAIKVSHNLGLGKWNDKHNNFIPNHVGSFFISLRGNKTHHNAMSRGHIGCCLSSFNQTQSFPVMEDQKKLSFSSPEPVNYSQELDVAVRTVQLACSLCQRVQNSLISKTSDGVQSKDDNSPVTVADWSVQATVSCILSESFGSSNVSIVAEEDIQNLSKAKAGGVLETVVKTVNECLAEAPRYGLEGPKMALGTTEVLEAISRCNSIGGPAGRFWALDPVDGTLGFVRGWRSCAWSSWLSNYPMRKEWLNYHHRIMDKGCVIYARRGSGEAWMQPLLHVNKNLVWPNSARPVRVSSIDNPSLATFCEPVEKANSSHSFTAGLAHSEAAIASIQHGEVRGYSSWDAEIFMKFARAGYKEKIWDHAAGVVIIQEAGGVVTDAGGRPLDFSKGIYLEGLDRGVIASAGANLHDKIIRAVDASWDSSAL